MIDVVAGQRRIETLDSFVELDFDLGCYRRWPKQEGPRVVEPEEAIWADNPMLADYVWLPMSSASVGWTSAWYSSGEVAFAGFELRVSPEPMSYAAFAVGDDPEQWTWTAP